MIQWLQGDCRDVLATLPAHSVHCVVTSPPYWGLRDYGGWFMCTLWGTLDHFPQPKKHQERWWLLIRVRATARGGIFCPQGCCWIGKLGLEPTIALFLAHMVEVMRGVWRVLRDDGTLWINMGDAYAGGNQGTVFNPERHKPVNNTGGNSSWTTRKVRTNDHSTVGHGLKPKDLIGQPWRLAFALQDDGWYLRSDIIWHKPNPMPESVQDRPTKSHEYVFLLTKRPRYFYDAEAIREKSTPAMVARATAGHTRGGRKIAEERNDSATLRPALIDAAGRNKRTVWTIPTQPYSGAHFATMPAVLVEPCIQAGTSERGCCAACGAPWRRVVEKSYTNPGNRTTNGPRSTAQRHETAGFSVRLESETATLGWEPGCTCEAAVVPCTVLDCFGGAGTSALVADRLGRDAISIELNAEYMAMAQARVLDEAPLLHQDEAEMPEDEVWTQPTLFDLKTLA